MDQEIATILVSNNGAMVLNQQCIQFSLWMCATEIIETIVIIDIHETIVIIDIYSL